MDKREVAKLVLVEETSVTLLALEGTMDKREVAKLAFVSVSLLAAARDLLQFLPGFAEKPGDCGVTCVHMFKQLNGPEF